MNDEVRAGVRTALLRGLLAFGVTLVVVLLNTVAVGQPPVECSTIHRRSAFCA